jgi:soluble lytic murein transglycosylase-like protein
MDQDSQKASSRASSCGKAFARFSLIVLLFAPALPAALQPRAPAGDDRPRAAAAAAVRDISGPRILTRIFSIIRPHRPEVAESEIWRLAEVIHEETRRRQLDPLMILALILVESRFQPDAVSPAGARGIMQIMPETGRTLAADHGFPEARFTAESLDDPIVNLRLGIHYLHDLKKQFRDWTATLTAYNFGPGDTLNRIESNTALSEHFATLVIDAYAHYQRSQHPPF